MDGERNEAQECVLEFIHRRFPNDCNWTNGNCYYFAKILKERFPEGEVCYDLIDGHFLFRYLGDCYDWTGVIHPDPDKLIPWKDFWSYDSRQYSRVVQACVM